MNLKHFKLLFCAFQIKKGVVCHTYIEHVGHERCRVSGASAVEHVGDHGGKGASQCVGYDGPTRRPRERFDLAGRVNHHQWDLVAAALQQFEHLNLKFLIFILNFFYF